MEWRDRYHEDCIACSGSAVCVYPDYGTTDVNRTGDTYA